MNLSEKLSTIKNNVYELLLPEEESKKVKTVISILKDLDKLIEDSKNLTTTIITLDLRIIKRQIQQQRVCYYCNRYLSFRRGITEEGKVICSDCLEVQ